MGAERIANGDQVAPNPYSIKKTSANNFTENKNELKPDDLRKCYFENNVSNLHMMHYIEQKIRTMNKKNLHLDTCPKTKNTNTHENWEKISSTSNLKEMEKTSSNLETQEWLTGIQEITLPHEYSFKNIEDTELAKQRLLNNLADFRHEEN